MEQTSLKMTEIWFDFRQLVNKARVQPDRLDYVHKIVKELNVDLDNQSGDFADFTNKDQMAAMLGQQPVGEVTILVPKVCKNKGNYFKKRLVNEREKVLNKSNKRIRKCKKCGAVTYGSRTCPKKYEEPPKKKGDTKQMLTTLDIVQRRNKILHRRKERLKQILLIDLVVSLKHYYFSSFKSFLCHYN
ncbi:hypothetical protein POM88_012915 [Heracleum sosnowskyi]|uniref:Uncharacterized protein n=1 Tax=Heracleum sosnowskyi TaxID=360622 RepID=A0AAD8N270_9APIA|nr:hypothetical protein POM88_012915 [Heracleum sosnowskyi]